MHTDITNKIFRYRRLLMLCGAILFAAAPSAHAALLSVEPTVTRMTVLPGWEWLGTVRVTNPGSEQVSVQIDSINLMSGSNPDDAPVPVVGESTTEREISLAGWMKLPIKQARIAPHSSVEIPVALIVPSYAGHGEHRAAIAFRQEGVRSGDGGVQVAATITSGLLVDVIGDENSRHEMTLARFGTDAVLGTSFPVDLFVRVENTGTTLGVLDGEVTVDSVLGFGSATFPVATAQEGRYLKPGSAYENTYTISDAAVGSRAGLYRASITIINGGDILRKTTYFAVIPMSAGFILLATLMITIGGARFVVRKGRKGKE